METRLYFLLGDLGVNACAGALTGIVCSAVVGANWNVLLAMIAGMLLGMLLAVPCALAAGILFGAFEVMLPVMLTGMVSGMTVSMQAAMAPLSIGAAMKIGAVAGLAALGFTYLLNGILRGEVKRWTA